MLVPAFLAVLAGAVLRDRQLANQRWTPEEVAAALWVFWDQVLERGLYPDLADVKPFRSGDGLPTLPPSWLWSEPRSASEAAVPVRLYGFRSQRQNALLLAFGVKQLLQKVHEEAGFFGLRFDESHPDVKWTTPFCLVMNASDVERRYKEVPYPAWTSAVARQWLLDILERYVDRLEERGIEHVVAYHRHDEGRNNVRLDARGLETLIDKTRAFIRMGRETDRGLFHNTAGEPTLEEPDRYMIALRQEIEDLGIMWGDHLFSLIQVLATKYAELTGTYNSIEAKVFQVAWNTAVIEVQFQGRNGREAWDEAFQAELAFNATSLERLLLRAEQGLPLVER